MTTIEKEFLSRKIVELIAGRDFSRAVPAESAKCIYCGREISENRFILLRDGENGAYTLACLDCGGARESLPSDNPLVFAGIARRFRN